MEISQSLEIRQARPEDAAGIVAVFNPIIEAGRYTTFDTPFTAEAERHYILSLTERDILHVAVRHPEEVVVGFQGLSTFPSYSRAFVHVGVMGTFVALDQRQQGIGGRLFAATFELARQMGYEKILTYVRADNTGGLVAYLKQGFRIVGTAQNQAKIGGRYVDEIIIEKLL